MKEERNRETEKLKQIIDSLPEREIEFEEEKVRGNQDEEDEEEEEEEEEDEDEDEKGQGGGSSTGEEQLNRCVYNGEEMKTVLENLNNIMRYNDDEKYKYDLIISHFKDIYIEEIYSSLENVETITDTNLFKYLESTVIDETQKSQIKEIIDKYINPIVYDYDYYYEKLKNILNYGDGDKYKYDLIIYYLENISQNEERNQNGGTSDPNGEPLYNTRTIPNKDEIFSKLKKYLEKEKLSDVEKEAVEEYINNEILGFTDDGKVLDKFDEIFEGYMTKDKSNMDILGLNKQLYKNLYYIYFSESIKENFDVDVNEIFKLLKENILGKTETYNKDENKDIILELQNKFTGKIDEMKEEKKKKIEIIKQIIEENKGTIIKEIKKKN